MVLEPLSADLALCVSESDLRSHGYDDAPKFVWSIDEPSNWGDRFDSSFPSSLWRKATEIEGIEESGLLGGPTEPMLPGSGGIGFWWLHFLQENLVKDGLQGKYRWLVILRSDFLWETPFPNIEKLSEDCVYVLDGEHYEGVSDRFLLIPMNVGIQYLKSLADVFAPNQKALNQLKEFASKSLHKNPESYKKMQLMRLGIWNKVIFLPYNGWALRSPQGTSRWSMGVYSRYLGVHVKYPDELVRALVTRLTKKLTSKRDLSSPGQAPDLQGTLIRVVSALVDRARLWPIMFLLRKVIGPPVSTVTNSQVEGV